MRNKGSEEGARPPSLGVVLVTHGGLAVELKAIAEVIVGPLLGVKAISIDKDVDVDRARAAIGEAIAEVDRGPGVLLLIDMLGGTPSNLSLSFLGQRKVEVVTGVNLPMLLKLPFILDKMDLKEAAAFIRDYGRKNIAVAGELLTPPEGGPAP
jgi:PTS system mannose-specific IIA component